MKHQAQSRFFLDIVVWVNVVTLQLFTNQKPDAVGQAGYPPCLWFGPWHSQWCHWAHSQGHWSCLSRSASLSTRPLALSHLATSLKRVSYHFNYNVSWCGSLWIHLLWNSLSFLDLNFCSLPQIREVFRYYFFKQISFSFLSLFF